MQSDPPAAARSFPEGLFQDRVALVTGGGTGLGLELARGLAALGAKVAIASRSREHHEAFLAEADDRGWSAHAGVVDVREPESVRLLAEEVEERFGAPEILVNNAAGNFVCPAERLSAKGWRAVLGIVLDGTFYCSREFGRRMMKGAGGSILNIVATYAWTGMPGVVHSSSAKAGVLAMTRTLAVEWASHGIRVNAVAPGPFFSEGAEERLWPDPEHRQRVLDRVPLGRFGTPEEMAAHCLYLLSPTASYVTGECFTADGGASLGQGMWSPGEGIRRRKASDGADPA